MEKFGDYVKKSVLNFKLEQCCWVASVRTGALTLACVNIILGLTILVVLSEEVKEGEERSFIPLLLQALQKTTDLEEDAPDFKSTCTIAYAVEIASNALLICAMWRNDIVLLRAYLYYSLGVLTLAVMVYSVVIGALTVIPELLLIASVGTQLYQIILVRSAMVEIKQASIKNGYTVNLKPNDKPSGSGPNEKYTVTIDTEKPKLPPKPVTKGDISKPVLKEVAAKVETDKTSVTVHSPAKQAFLREEAEEAKEGVKPSRVFVKEKAKIERAKPERIEVTKKLKSLQATRTTTDPYAKSSKPIFNSNASHSRVADMFKLNCKPEKHIAIVEENNINYSAIERKPSQTNLMPSYAQTSESVASNTQIPRTDIKILDIESKQYLCETAEHNINPNESNIQELLDIISATMREVEGDVEYGRKRRAITTDAGKKRRRYLRQFDP